MSEYKANADKRDEVFNTRKRDLNQKNNLEVEAHHANIAELEKSNEQLNTLSENLNGVDPWLSQKEVIDTKK